MRSGEPLRIRAWYASAWKRLFLGFRVPPVVKWDIELRLFWVGLPLPDWLEDSLPGWAVATYLSTRGTSEPFKVKLGGEDDKKDEGAAPAPAPEPAP